MTSINPQWIEAGTDALMVCLYGEDLGLADRWGMFDGQVRMHREQVTDVLTAVVPLIAGDREQRAAELRERLMDLVGDYEQATILMAGAAADLTASAEQVSEHTTRQRRIRDEILRLSGELRDLTKIA